QEARRKTTQEDDSEKLLKCLNLGGLDWRPLTMLRADEGTLANTAKKHNVSGMKIALVQSQYPGLLEEKMPIIDKEYAARSEREDRAHGCNGERGAYYVASASRPYELYMNCQAPSSSKCTAHVFLKRSHFQYAMIFPPNQLEHADQLISRVNNMIEGWLPANHSVPRFPAKGQKK
ncbi:hypothetical protein, partial [Massilia sp. TSP1-1-2]|uniref:hypothetical protein n=1 Tax=Massilia sp. TSP1-1-2 TaxID=2804649 RepID=UPI003CF48D81